MWHERFATQLVGSWVKPHWLADHAKVYAREGSWWRVAEEHRAGAISDAVRLAIFDQDRAGLTYVTDGENRRQTFSGHFYSGLRGIDTQNPGEFTNFHSDILPCLDMRQKPRGVGGDSSKAESRKVLFPRVVDKLSWSRPILGDDVRFLREHTTSRTKVTVIGPVTLAYRLVDDGVYGSEEKLAYGVAEALNQELRFLAGLGVDLIQIDEPEIHFRYTQCKPWAVEAIDRMVAGVQARTAVHVCYGYSKNISFKRQSPVYSDAVALIANSQVDAISVEYEQPRHTPEFLEALGNKDVILGLLDLNPEGEVETTAGIVDRVLAAAQVVAPERISLAPDCGMWFLPRERAFRKLRAMALAAQVLRN